MSITLNGSSEYLQVDTPLVTGLPMSCSAWFNSTSTVATQTIFMVCDKDASNMWYQLNLFGGVLGATQRDTGNTAAANATTGYSAGTWYNAIGIWTSDSSRTVYQDGANNATETTAQDAISEDRTVIGRSGDSTPGDYFAGSIAEVGVWNRVLDAGEIASLADGFSPLFFLRGLIMYRPLVRSTNDIAKGFAMTEVDTPSVGTHPRIIYPTAEEVRRMVASAAPSTAVRDIIYSGIIPFAR